MFLRVSLSCYKWLTEQLACHGWQMSHTVACTHSSASWHRSLRYIFMSLSGVGSAAKREDPLGRDGCSESFQRPGTVWPGSVDSTGSVWSPALCYSDSALCPAWLQLEQTKHLVEFNKSWNEQLTECVYCGNDSHYKNALSYSCLYNWPPMAARCWVNFSLQLKRTFTYRRQPASVPLQFHNILASVIYKKDQICGCKRTYDGFPVFCHVYCYSAGCLYWIPASHNLNALC